VTTRTTNANPINDAMLSEVSEEAPDKNRLPDFCASPKEHCPMEIRGAASGCINQYDSASFPETFAPENQVTAAHGWQLLG
jgi:hypothetical protein